MSPAAVTTASTTLPSTFAITTTFTAPPQCAQSLGGLTMLEKDSFRIWLNAPLPVQGTTFSSCYPDQYMSSFLLQTAGVSQAPFSPLVCPEGYTTQGPFTSNYIACCPSGWDGFAPAPNAPSDRPAFGGTCYTNIFNVPIQITSYDDSSIKASSIFTATNSGDQAFAYPYEGFALGVAVLASITKSSQSTATPTLGSSPFDGPDTGSGGMKSGTVAALVIGTVAAISSLVMLGMFALNYRQKRLTDRRAQFRFYDSHVRLAASPTPMMHMNRNRTRSCDADSYSGKGIDVGYETMSAGDKKDFYELEGSRRRTLYEMEAAPLPVTKTKLLPDLPQPTKTP